MIVAAAIALALLGDAWVRAGWASVALLAPWVLLAVWGVYVTVFVSAIATDADGIQVRNLLRITRASWGQVADIAMGYQIVVTLHDGGRMSCLGGPVRGRPRRRGLGERPAAPRPGDEHAPSAEGTTGVDQADRVIEDWRRAGAVPGTGSVRRSWDLPALCVLAVLVVWAAVAVIIVSGT